MTCHLGTTDGICTSSAMIEPSFNFRESFFVGHDLSRSRIVRLGMEFLATTLLYPAIPLFARTAKERAEPKPLSSVPARVYCMSNHFGSMCDYQVIRKNYLPISWKFASEIQGEHESEPRETRKVEIDESNVNGM